MGEAPEEWAFGDLEAGFRDAAIVVDETFVVPSTSHQTMESRSAMSYWQNGKLFLYGSTQSVIRTVENVARWVGIDQAQVVLISEYCGGGFGSKGTGAVSMAIPALLSKKVGAPVMMRISREEEQYIGRARTGMVGRAKVGFRKDGRITALDLFIVQDNGAVRTMGDSRTGAQRGVADLAAAGDALAQRERADEHASAAAAAIARPRPAQRDHGPGGHEGGQAARARSGRDSPDERARREGAVRSPRRRRYAAARDRLVRQGRARSRRRAVQVGRTQGPGRQTSKDRRSVESAWPSDLTGPDRSASTAS